MVQTPSKALTLDKFLNLPETQPASEFIEGRVIKKPMPQGKHSTVQLDLGADINRSLKSQHIARAYSELRCTFGGRSLVPELVVFTGERIPCDANGEVANTFAIAPDWTIEILSPVLKPNSVDRKPQHHASKNLIFRARSARKIRFLGFWGARSAPQNSHLRSTETKAVLNILHCLAHGTQMGWLIDPEEKLVFVYFADRTLAVFEGLGDRIPVPAFADAFNLTVGQICNGLEE